MELVWLGTAGFKISAARGAALLVDPFCAPSRAVGAGVQAILLTHGHFDHALHVPAWVRATDATVHCSRSVGTLLLRKGVPAERVVPLAGGQGADIGSIRVRAIRSVHVRYDLPLVWRTLCRCLPQARKILPLAIFWPRREVLAWCIEADGVRLVHFGSAGWIDSQVAGLRPDVALIPVQGRTNIIAVAANLVAALQPRVAIPQHWDDFFPPLSQLVSAADFSRAVAQRCAAVRVVIPTPGAPLHPEDYLL